ncbi:MAG: hypothetical protein HPY76_13130 [Anaerolineae bacterium]|nr:hypothetical protein [Anaerolineae bacterium]
MKGRKFLILFPLLALVLTSLACGGSFTTANIPEAWMSTDEAGSNRTSVFTQDAVFYAQVQLKNAPDDTTVKAVWTAVSAEGVDPNFVIDETEFTSSDDLIHFSLSNDQLWPPGQYQVEIFLNGSLDKTLTFSVQ